MVDMTEKRAKEAYAIIAGVESIIEKTGMQDDDVLEVFENFGVSAGSGHQQGTCYH